MTTTSPRIVLYSNGVAIREDIASVTATLGGVQMFCDPATDFATEVVQNKWITFEPDMWQLDGSFRFMPAAPHVGYMSTNISDDLGQFDEPCVIEIVFNTIQSVNLSLYFSQLTNDYCVNINITYYDIDNVEIQTDIHALSTWYISTGVAVTDVKKIEIILIDTNKPYRFARLTAIDFDTLTRWTGAEIKSGQLVEAIDPTSLELPSNELSFTLHSDDNDFSIVSPSGVYATLHENQPIDAHEEINGAMLYLGRFYLKEWESLSETEAKFVAVDAISLLGEIDFEGFYDFSSSVSQKLDAIIRDAAGFEYALDSSLTSLVDCDGDMPRFGNCRDNLQLICLAIGGYATCKRSKIINILPLEIAADLSEQDYEITNADKFINSPLSLRPFVTGVNVVGHSYTYDPDTIADGYRKILVDSVYDSGTYTVYANNFQIWGISVDAGGAFVSVQEYNSNRIIFTVTDTANILITASEMKDEKTSYVVGNESLPVGTPQNVVIVTDATLITSPNILYSNNATNTAQRLYDYFQQRYVQKTKLFAHPITIGESALVDVQNSRQMSGIVERMKTNLVGFVSEVEIVGNLVAL